MTSGNPLLSTAVEFRPLSAVARRNQGTAITAGRMKQLHRPDGSLRVFAAGSTVADVDPSALPGANVTTDPSVIVKSRGVIGFAYYDRPFTHKNEMWSYTPHQELLTAKFLYYFLQTQASKLQVLARANSVKLPQLTVGDTDRLLVPLPPLEAQERIVSTLDSLSELQQALQAELESEIDSRILQKQHTQATLLTFQQVHRETEQASKKASKQASKQDSYH